MARPEQPGRRTRRAQRIACEDGYHKTQFVGLWPVPTLGVVVMVAPPARSARFSLAQATSLRAALDAAIAELRLPGR